MEYTYLQIVILWILVIFLVIFIIILISWNSVIKANLILPENCGKSSELGVIMNKQITVLNTCGINKNEQCIFLNVPSLQDALGRCTLNNCTSFTYSDSTHQMLIVDGNNLLDGGTYDVYLNNNNLS